MKKNQNKVTLRKGTVALQERKTTKREKMALVKSMSFAIALALLVITVISTSGCGALDSKINNIKGMLIGNSYTAEFYDNYGAKFLTVSGKKVDIDGNIVEELGVDSEGDYVKNYSLSSVITITIDGKQMSSCGNTVIFAEEVLKPDVDFNLSDIDSTADSGLSDLTSAAKVVNKYKNYFGKQQVVVIQSQLGVPICAYSGKKVYWEIPDDLPKMTKLMIDDKALYVHRANFEIIDKALIQ